MFKDFPLDCADNALEKVTKIIDENKNTINDLLKIENKTFINFVRPLAETSLRLNEYVTPLSHLNAVCDSEKNREAMSSVLGPISIYSTEISQNEDIYNAFKEISKDKNLTQEQRKTVEDNLQAFELSGVSLDNDKKKRIMEINQRLSQLSEDFSKNLLDATNAFELVIEDESIIPDMPESDKLTAKTDAGFKFTLQAPSYTAFMTYCTDKDLREKMYKAYMTRALNNSPIMEEMLALKNEKAHILGYKNHRELRNVTMSCPSADEAILFLKNLLVKGKPYAEKEVEELKAFAKTKGIDKVDVYDTAYLSNLLKKEVLNFDEEEFRPYFEKNNVIDGLFNFLKKLFNIDFKEVKDTPIWNESVKCFDLIDENGKVFSRLYSDMEARPEKRGGAWMNEWQTGRIDANGAVQLPSAFISGNFPPSTPENPSLLRHRDVETLFHEAGHAIHHLFSKCKESDVSGINGVEWDAVEFPSQFLENFAFEPAVLRLFAKHYKTGEIIPDALIDKLVKNKNFQSGLFLLRQLEFGIFDLLIHDNAYSIDEIHNKLLEVRKETSLIDVPEYNRFENGFGHIFGGGYSAGYYSYKWAEMLSADGYLAFSEKGVFDKEIADSYKNHILAKGGSDTMNKLFVEFMGRAPKEEKLLELMGMK